MTFDENSRISSEIDIQSGLVNLFATILELNTVHADDDFFELGGDSLLVIRLVTRARQQLSIDLTPGDVFDHPTASSLARFLHNR